MDKDKGNGRSAKPELKLNLTCQLPRGEPSALMRMETEDEDDDSDLPTSMASSTSSGLSLTSDPPSSCVSSANSPQASKSMVVAGCPRCLVYVMLPVDDAKCPQCNNAVLVNFGSKNKNI